MNSIKASEPTNWIAKNGRTAAHIQFVPEWAQQKLVLTDEILNSLTPEELELLQWEWTVIGRRKQIPPSMPYRVWVILAGRGFGKSRTASEFIKMRAEALPEGQGLIVTRSSGDINKTFRNGPSGLIRTARPGFEPRFNQKDNAFVYPNGHIVWAVSAEQPDQIRGPSVHYSVADEFASWRYAEECWDNIQLATREGQNSQILAISTPRPTEFVKTLVTSDNTVVTTGSTYENTALDDEAKKYFITKYEGTTIGAQELHASILGDITGKMFSQAKIDQFRLPTREVSAREFARKLTKVVVSVDPAVTSGADADATGIIVAGQDADGTVIILDDYTTQGTPSQWAEAAVTAYHRYEADLVVVETNNGGEMCELTLRTQDPLIRVARVNASRGKAARAEPIAALYEQGRVRHYGSLPDLENEMVFFTPGQRSSPNRMDAMVWAATHLTGVRSSFRFNVAYA